MNKMNEEQQRKLDEQFKVLEEQKQYVDENIKELMGVYSERYVAVYKKRVIDSDSDEFELAKRIEKRQKFDLTEPALITKIHTTIESYIEDRDREIELSSIEIEGDQ